VLSLLLQKGTEVFGLVTAVFLIISAAISLLLFREPAERKTVVSKPASEDERDIGIIDN